MCPLGTVKKCPGKWITGGTLGQSRCLRFSGRAGGRVLALRRKKKNGMEGGRRTATTTATTERGREKKGSRRARREERKSMFSVFSRRSQCLPKSFSESPGCHVLGVWAGGGRVVNRAPQAAPEQQGQTGKTRTDDQVGQGVRGRAGGPDGQTVCRFVGSGNASSMRKRRRACGGMGRWCVRACPPPALLFFLFSSLLLGPRH